MDAIIKLYRTTLQTRNDFQSIFFYTTKCASMSLMPQMFAISIRAVIFIGEFLSEWTELSWAELSWQGVRHKREFNYLDLSIVVDYKVLMLDTFFLFHIIQNDKYAEKLRINEEYCKNNKNTNSVKYYTCYSCCYRTLISGFVYAVWLNACVYIASKCVHIHILICIHLWTYAS